MRRSAAAKDAPNPAPATAWATNMVARLAADAPAGMPIVPMIDAHIPAAIRRRGPTGADNRLARADAAGARNPHMPLRRPLSRWNTVCTMLGASPPERPDSLQTAAIAGRAAANSVRAEGGTAILGSSERSAPGAPSAVSGDTAMTRIPN